MRTGIGEFENFDGRGRGGTSEDSEGGGTCRVSDLIREIEGSAEKGETYLGIRGLRDNLRGVEGIGNRSNRRAVQT